MLKSGAECEAVRKGVGKGRGHSGGWVHRWGRGGHQVRGGAPGEVHDGVQVALLQHEGVRHRLAPLHPAPPTTLGPMTPLYLKLATSSMEAASRSVGLDSRSFASR